VIPEGEDQAPRDPSRGEFERDVLAERRARRAGGGEAAQLRGAEADVRELEQRLADLTRRHHEAEREHRGALEQLAEREHDLRRVKQREYAEQQLRIEAEEDAARLRRRHRAELDRLRRRVEEARGAMLAAGERAEELRERAEERRRQAESRCAQAERRAAQAERGREQATRRAVALGARLDAVSESCARLRTGALRLEGATAELGYELERERAAARARILELERQCAASEARARALELRTAGASRTPPRDAAAAGAPGVPEARREEMAQALAAAVERLRARVSVVEELQAPAEELEPPGEDLQTRPEGRPSAPRAAASPRGAAALPSPPTAPPAGAPGRVQHKHSRSLIARWRAARAARKQRREAR
jgi:chromosome segregation ATPase